MTFSLTSPSNGADQADMPAYSHMFDKGMISMYRKFYLSLLLVSAIFLMTLSAASAVDVSTAEELQNAFTSGGDVKLTADVTGSFDIPSGSTVSLNLNGHTISNSSYAPLSNYGTLTVTDSDGNGKLTGNYGIYVYSDSVTTFNSGTIVAQEFCIAGLSTTKNATVTVNDGTMTSNDNGVLGFNGMPTAGGNRLTVNGGTFNGKIQTEGYVACGIYSPNNDVITVTGGTFNIENGAGIVARAGTVTISGDVVINTNGSATGKVGDSRQVVNCSALVFDGVGGSNYPGLTSDSNITVTGGTFRSEIDTIQTIAADENERIILEGGSFSSNPADYVAEGYGAVLIDDVYVVDVWTFTEFTMTAATEGEGYTAVANYIGTNSGKTATVEATVASEVTTEATCTDAGVTTYTASIAAEDSLDETEHTGDTENGGVKTADLPEATGHAWGDPEWEWAQDYSYANATFVCANDESHTEKLTDREIDTSIGDDGTVTYTATVTLDNKDYSDVQTVTPKPEQITVTYDANGAEGTVPETVTLDAQNNSTEVADQGDLVNGELPFSGWNTEADGNGTAYSAGDTITYEDLEGNITLYAQWGEETEGNYTAEWTWEKVSKTNYKATATFTDENGTVVAENVKATVTSKTEGDITTYTATVNFEGTDYTDEKSFYNGGFGTPQPVIKVRAGVDLVKAMIDYLVNGTPLPEDYMFDLNEDNTIDGRDLIELEKIVSENGFVYKIVQ